MPGIIGFQGTSDPSAASALMDAMIKAMDLQESSLVEKYVQAEIGLARMHLNIIDKAPQPLWSNDGNTALVMTGEIFSWDGFAADQVGSARGGDFSNAALLLAAYATFGVEFPKHVNGTFAAAIWDKAEQTLLLVSDPLTSYPLYYAHVGDLLVFGSGARAVAAAPGLPRAINPEAMAELIAFEHIYGDKTLFPGVQLVMPGTVLRFRKGQLTQEVYVDFQYPEYYELKSEEHYIDQWIELMRQAVARQARGPYPLGVMLTGGLDSRTILGMLAGNNVDIRTMTFGIPDCDDEQSARQLAAMLHLPHKFFPLAPDYLTRLGSRAVRATDGQKSVVHCSMIGTLDSVVQESKVLYKGFLGGTIHGYVVSHDRLAPVRDDIWFEYVFSERNRIFKEQELADLYTPALYRQVRDVPRRSLRQALERSRSTWWVDKDSYIDLYEEDVRFTIMGVELARTQALVRTPLADNDLLRFTMSVPPGYRVDKSYYRRAVIKAFPDLAKVVYSGSRRPLNEASFRDLRMRIDEHTRWWLRNRGASWIPVQSARPYADYANWLRHELRPWVEATLLAPQALDRGNLQPAFVRKLVAEHMAGCDHTRRISLLLTLELWQREFLD